ncbi:DUF4384 domain-containing protein [Azospirillum isscasi]|uniref:DUF4384 domain-containing protein n=1 Tax=Azospirillum isscasi TaxID=3053926 RepID=A0ABU0WGM3_9PROT|nr:DUF4384 domain-containing protein [Azospirillum isscasi]MDQ2103347.1 DUF4384 domain-containing protein [Azospirillum isscasi]
MAQKTLSGLVGAALTLAAFGAAAFWTAGLTASRAAAEQAVVVASTAPGYAQGQLVPDGAAVNVPDGANAMFLFANGRMLRVKGPFDGPLDRMPDASGWSGVGSLVGGERFFQTDLGAARAVGSPLQKGEEQVFTLDPGRAGIQCVKSGGTVLVRKPADPALVPATLREESRAAAATLRWDKGATVPWPRELPMTDGGAFSVAGPDGRVRHNLTLRVISADGQGAELAVRLAGAGCATQAAALLDPVRDSVAPLNLYLATDRGLYPTYRSGETVTLVLQTNRDAHVYCYLRNTRGQLTPIYPPGPSASSLVEGHHTLTLAGDRMPVPLRAAERAGSLSADQEVRCFAAGRDLGADLPGRRDAFRPLTDEAAARLERTLNSLKQTELVMAQVILRVE